MTDDDSNRASTPEYLLARNANAYLPAWADRRLRRLVLITGFPTIFVGFPFGAFYFLTLTWYAGGFRCPRCRERFAGRRLSLLFGRQCATCSLAAGSKRDLSERPMFPRLFGDGERRGAGGKHPAARGGGSSTLDERGDDNNPFRPPASD